ncbi:MAG: DinB family protein [Anaerolineales bacterium]|nr:DinB family protein [Anaerolineales bacterium]
MTSTITPPTTDEYAPFYADYIQRAQARDVLSLLPQQIEDIKSALGHLTNDQARFKFGPPEWSIKEVLGHLNDGERVFSYRLLRISRNDQTPLPGFEQEDYVRAAKFDNYALTDLIHEFEFLRRANILAIKNMSDESTLYRGTASGTIISARALIYIMVGHVEHHMACLREKYLPNLK